MLEVRIDSWKKDRFLIHLPEAVIRIAAESEEACSILKNSRTLPGIDMKQLWEKIQEGCKGEVFCVDNEDGDHIVLELQ